MHVNLATGSNIITRPSVLTPNIDNWINGFLTTFFESNDQSLSGAIARGYVPISKLNRLDTNTKYFSARRAQLRRSGRNAG